MYLSGGKRYRISDVISWLPKTIEKYNYVQMRRFYHVLYDFVYLFDYNELNIRKIVDSLRGRDFDHKRRLQIEFQNFRHLNGFLSGRDSRIFHLSPT